MSRSTWTRFDRNVMYRMSSEASSRRLAPEVDRLRDVVEFRFNV